MSSLSEFLDPAYARRLMEELRLNVSMALSSLSRVCFDDASRLYVRAGWVDDGYLRVRDQNWTGFSLVDMVQEAARALQGMLGAIEYPITSIAGALASRATDKLRTSVIDALPESPFNLTKISGTAQTARDWSGDFAKLQNLDTALTTLAKLIKWSRAVDPVWVDGSEVTAPAAGTALVSKTVSTGKSGYIYGFFITAQEANDFKINWTSGGTAYSKRIVFAGKGSLQYVDFVAFNEGKPADAGSSVTITNVNAGGSGIVYQCSILYTEL